MNPPDLPFLDLRTAMPGAEEAVRTAVDRVVARGWYLLGEELEGFEAEFAQYLGVDHVVGVGSGTDALMLILRGLKIGPGDEVITAANTCVPTVAAICATGATPVLVDARPDTLGIDSDLIAHATTPRTKAIVPVHLYGIPCDMDALQAVADAHGVLLIEDAAQAHGSQWNRHHCGSMSPAAAFSFYPTKNLGALGDAGAIATNDAKLAETLRLLRSHGDTGGFNHTLRATNSRMDEIQAAVLRAKLPHLDTWNRQRRNLAAHYLESLQELPLQLPSIPDGAHWNAHLFPIRSNKRDELRAALASSGIGTMIHYPRPIHLQPAYRKFGDAGQFSIAEEATNTTLSVPLHPGLGEDEQERVILSIRQFYGNS